MAQVTVAMHKAPPRLGRRYQLGIRSRMFGCGQYCSEYGHRGQCWLTQFIQLRLRQIAESYFEAIGFSKRDKP